MDDKEDAYPLRKDLLGVLGSDKYLEYLEERLGEKIKETPWYTGEDTTFLGLWGTQFMMNDYYNYENPETVPDVEWDNFCDRFNSSVSTYGVISKELHYFRNNLNRAPESLGELIEEKEKWKLLAPGTSQYHMYHEYGEYNLKYITKGNGKFEGVYRINPKSLKSYEEHETWDDWQDGASLTEKNDSVNMGTYNYSDPDLIIGHSLYDVFPWKKWGNVEGQPEPDGESRFELAYEGLPDKYRKFIENQ